MTFADLGLSPELLAAVEASGYRDPTPIQAQAIPVILQGKDVLGIAQTGTGKTASFCLPMIDLLAQGRTRARMPRSLILSPVRELATQTAEAFDRYGVQHKLSKALLIGGVGLGEQQSILERGVDVLIATPGRLLDQFERGNVLLGGVEILVIDEADRMLDMGFIPDVERIVQLLLKRRQTLFFSATMPREVRRLADQFLNDPVEIQVAPPATTAELVEDVFVKVDGSALPAKEQALRDLIRTRDVGKALVFCNRKTAVSALRRKLGRFGLRVSDIHGDLDQSEREQALDAFKRDEIDYLVATDVAARGLDISQLPNVINFDVPIHAEDYVHRIGRTGRAGRAGRAFTLATPEDGRFVDAILRLTGRAIPVVTLDGDAAALEPAEPRARRRRGTGDAAQPAAGRGRRGAPRRPAAVAATEAVVAETTPAAAALTVEAEPVTDTPARLPRPEPRRRDDRPGARRPSRRDVALEVRARESAGPAPLPRPAKREGDAVVGLGDHVPAFLLRPVVRPPLPATED